MIYRLIVVLFFFLVSFTDNKEKTQKFGYIKFQYLGETAKPHPILFFYLPNSIDTSYENFYTYKFEVTTIQFNCIIKAVAKKKKPIDSFELRDPLGVLIEQDGESTIEYIKSKSVINEMFNTISSYFNDVATKEKVQECLSQIFRRLPE